MEVPPLFISNVKIRTPEILQATQPLLSVLGIAPYNWKLRNRAVDKRLGNWAADRNYCVTTKMQVLLLYCKRNYYEACWIRNVFQRIC